MVFEFLSELNRKRQGAADAKTLAYYTSSLSGFHEETVRRACEEIAEEPIGQFTPRWPPLSRFQEICRRYEPKDETAWTLERYRDAWYIDRYITECLKEGKRREDVLADIDARFPSIRPMWVKWRNQVQAGTIQIPFGWCEECQGSGLIPVWGPSPNVSITNLVVLKMDKCRCRRNG